MGENCGESEPGLMNLTKRLLRSGLDVLFPVRCVGCGGSGAYICAACLAEVRRSPPSPPPESGPLAGVLTPFAYEGVVREAVRRLKYRGLRGLVPEMARPMTRELALAVPPPFTLVPVPLHPARLRERGFNQAELLARAVARSLDAPLDVGALRRSVETPSQVSMRGLAERLRNVRGAFAATGALDGETVVLVDDVTTTGATLYAAAQTLLSAGASRVYGLAFAHEE